MLSPRAEPPALQALAKLLQLKFTPNIAQVYPETLKRPVQLQLVDIRVCPYTGTAWTLYQPNEQESIIKSHNQTLLEATYLGIGLYLQLTALELTD